MFYKYSINSLASLIENFFTLLFTFVVTPILVSTLGVELFGLWKTAERFIAFIKAADGRPAQGLQFMISRNIDNNPHLIEGYIHNSYAVWIMFIPAVIILGFFLVWIFPLLTNTDYYFLFDIRVALVIMVLTFIIYSFISIPIAVLTGVNLKYKKLPLFMFYLFILLIFIIFSSKNQLGVIGIAASYFFSMIVMSIMILITVQKNVVWSYSVRPKLLNFKRYMKLNGWYILWSFVNKLMLNSDVVILGYILSATFVASYSVSNFLPQSLMTIAMLISTNIAPGLGKIIGDRKYNKALRLRNEMFAYILYFSTLIGSIVLIFNQSFVELWVNEVVYVGNLTVFLLVILSIQTIAMRSDAVIIDTTLDIKEKTFSGFLSFGLALFLSFYLVPEYEVAGLCIAFLISRALLSVYFIKIIYKKFNIKYKTFEYKKILISFLFLVASYGLSTYVLVTSWVQLFLMSFFVFIALAIFYYFTLLDICYREKILLRLNGLVKNQRGVS